MGKHDPLKNLNLLIWVLNLRVGPHLIATVSHDPNPIRHILRMSEIE